MATTVSWNYSDSGIYPAIEKSLEIPSLNFTSDFVKKETKANEALLANLTSPLGRAETVRFAYQRIANIYNNTGIDPSVYAASKYGFSVLAQLNDILTVVDDTTGYRVDLPLSAHLVVKGPQNEAITGERLRTLVARLVALLYEQTADTPDSRLNSLIRGAVLPKALA